MIFKGETLTAMEAYQFGLAEKVCSRESLMDEVHRLAMKIASNGPFAVKACKGVSTKAWNFPWRRLSE